MEGQRCGRSYGALRSRCHSLLELAGTERHARWYETGIEEINTLVASGDMGAPTLYGDAVYTLDIPADKDVQYISANYKGARFIAAPVYVGTELYMIVLEVRDGKVQNHFVEALH